MNILKNVLIIQIFAVALVYGQSLDSLPQRGQRVPQATNQWYPGGSRIVQNGGQWSQNYQQPPQQAPQRMAQMAVPQVQKLVQKLQIPPGQRFGHAAQAIDGYMNLLQSFFEPKKFGSQSFGQDPDNCREFEQMFRDACFNKGGPGQQPKTVQQFCDEFKTRCNIILGNNFWHAFDGGIKKNEVLGGVKNVPFLPSALNDFTKNRATDTQFGITGFQQTKDQGFGNFFRRGNGVVADWMNGRFGKQSGWSIPILGLEGGKRNEVNINGFFQPKKILNGIANIVNGGK